MTNEEVIHKLEYSKKAYQMLIDEKVYSGKLVGKDIEGEWKADTPLDEAYKSMIEALDLAINLLEQQPCGDCINREATIDAIYKRHIGGKDAVENAPINDLYACGLEEAVDAVENMPSVTPQPSEEDIHREREQAYMLGYEDASKKFRTELKQRREADKVADAQLKELIEEVRK